MRNDETGQLSGLSIIGGVLAIIVILIFVMFQLGLIGGSNSTGSTTKAVRSAHQIVPAPDYEHELLLCAEGMPSIYSPDPGPSLEAKCLSEEGARAPGLPDDTAPSAGSTRSPVIAPGS